METKTNMKTNKKDIATLFTTLENLGDAPKGTNPLEWLVECLKGEIARSRYMESLRDPKEVWEEKLKIAKDRAEWKKKLAEAKAKKLAEEKAHKDDPWHLEDGGDGLDWLRGKK
jgi:hypothetical protein